MTKTSVLPNEFLGDAPFNMALAFLERLHIALMGANEAKEQDNTFAWKEFLDTLYLELRPYMRDTENMRERGLALSDFKKLLDEANQLYYNMQRRFKGNSGEFINSPLDRLNWEMEENLRILMHINGLLQPKQHDPSRAIAGG